MEEQRNNEDVRRIENSRYKFILLVIIKCGWIKF